MGAMKMTQTHITIVTWTEADTLKHPENQRVTSYTNIYSTPTPKGATGGPVSGPQSRGEGG